MKINIAADYILEDDRVLLRPLKAEDIEHLAHFTSEEPYIWKYSVATLTGADGMKEYIDTALAARQECKEYPFIVYDKKQQQYAGCTRFYDIQLKYGTMQLGYTWYGKDFQRTGLNRHCKYLLLSFAFEDIEAKRVEFRADADNAKSIAAMKAIGCTVEGILRSHMPKADGTRRNSIILSILKKEWASGLKAKLFEKL